MFTELIINVIDADVKELAKIYCYGARFNETTQRIQFTLLNFSLN